LRKGREERRGEGRGVEGREGKEKEGKGRKEMWRSTTYF